MGSETECINRFTCGTSIGLHSCCHESLGEEECGNPERVRWSAYHPVVDELETVNQVSDPGAQKLEGWITDGDVHPGRGHLVVDERLKDLFKRRRHDFGTLDSVNQRIQVLFDHLEKSIESLHFLLDKDT